MGNGVYNQQLNHLNLHFNRQNKGTFLPMLCSKPSIKDVVILPKWRHRSSSASFSDDPLSPKISCMGQVKRNNKILGFPASQKLHITNPKNSCNNGIKYFKLKKLFSGKHLTSSPTATDTATAAATNNTISCRKKQALVINGGSRPKNDNGKENFGSINIKSIDPPLPVIKRVPKQGDKERDGHTLWQRRSRSGVSLKSLQLQQIQLNRHQEPTTVWSN